MRPVLQRWRLANKGTDEHAKLFQLLIDYLDASVDMQHRQTPSGGYTDGGLGEGPSLQTGFGDLVTDTA